MTDTGFYETLFPWLVGFFCVAALVVALCAAVLVVDYLRESARRSAS